MIEYIKYSEHELEEALKNYCSNAHFVPTGLFCLTSYKSNIDRRLFGLIKDLRINLVFCNFDYIKAGLKNYSARCYSQQDAKLEELLFYQYHTSNFIIRFRAIGDKVMRLLVYLHASESDKKKFDKSSSRLKTFIKICDQNAVLKKYQDMANIFRKLDEQYRTDEIHGMGGKLQKSILTKKSTGIDNPVIQIGNYWNILTCNLCIFNDIYIETLKK